jgi:hypothetical protein
MCSIVAALVGFQAGLAAAIAYSFAAAPGIVVGTIFVVCGAVLVFRAWSSCLLADQSGVTIRNIWTTRRWGWAQIGEVGWDAPGWARSGVVVAISVCPLGDQYTYPATGTAASWPDHQRRAAALAPFLVAHGVTNALGRETAAIFNWPYDARARRATNDSARD